MQVKWAACRKGECDGTVGPSMSFKAMQIASKCTQMSQTFTYIKEKKNTADVYSEVLVGKRQGTLEGHKHTHKKSPLSV